MFILQLNSWVETTSALVVLTIITGFWTFIAWITIDELRWKIYHWRVARANRKFFHQIEEYQNDFSNDG